MLYLLCLRIFQLQFSYEKRCKWVETTWRFVRVEMNYQQRKTNRPSHKDLWGERIFLKKKEREENERKIGTRMCSQYHIIHWRTTTCTMRLWVNSPYMALSKGMPMTSVLGKVAIEKRVMSQSNPPLKKTTHADSRTRTKTFERVSASMNLVSIWYGLFWAMKWKDSTGTAKTATNLLIPEHCSGVNILYRLTDPYATSIAKYRGTIAHMTL